jgi:hypothetical protein
MLCMEIFGTPIPVMIAYVPASFKPCLNHEKYKLLVTSFA